MGLIDSKVLSVEGAVSDLGQRKIGLVLSHAEMALVLRDSDVVARSLPLTTVTLDTDSAIPGSVIGPNSILCLEVQSGSTASLDRIRHIRQHRPELPVIAAVRDADVALVRALLKTGVCDVIELPLSIRQLTESIGEVLARGDHAPGKNPLHDQRHGKLISVVKSIGGVGATNVAVHLATAMTGGLGTDRACLFDLDVQFGNAATYLGISGQPSLSELLEGGNRVDGDFLQTVASTLPSGLRFVPAPPEIGPLESIDDAQLQRVLKTARMNFEYVVTDMPANWANWTLSVVAQSDLVILVVNLTIASLRQGRRQLHLLRSQGIDPGRIAVLVNRVEQRLFRSIDLEDAARALGHSVKLSVHNDYATMSAANNQGMIVEELNRKSKVVRDFKAIAEALPSLIAKRD